MTMNAEQILQAYFDGILNRRECVYRLMDLGYLECQARTLTADVTAHRALMTLRECH